MNAIKTALRDPYRVPYFLIRRIAPLYRNDEKYLKWYYFWNMHKFPNLKCPKTFNEKLTWLKLHDKHPEYTPLVDKYAVKSYVAEKAGEKYVIPTLGVWDKVEDIDFNTLPQQFVLKTTNDSGGILICRDKNQLNYEQAQKRLKKALRRHFYAENREYPYMDVKPRIIAEKLLEVEPGQTINDYKFFCFDGEVKMLFVATDRPKDTRFDFFDLDFNHLPVKQGHPLADKPIEKPEGFEEMKELARTLSQGFPHVRVDLYDINGQVYFGELTFFHFSANMPFEPEEWDYKMGEWLKLPID